MNVITNHHRRDVLFGWDLTDEEKKEFDYIKWDEDEYANVNTFFRYKGELYDLGEFTALSAEWGENGRSLAGLGWHGYLHDSFFSGIVVKYVDEGMDHCVVVGRYMV